jgi:hypothetical protein
MFHEVQEYSLACKTGLVMKQTSGSVEIPCHIFSYSDTCGWINECEPMRHLLLFHICIKCVKEGLCPVETLSN